MGPGDINNGPPTSPTDAVAALFLDENEVVLAEDIVPVGTIVSGYEIEGQIGKGSMGVVYAATHPVIGKRAAIKVLRSELSDSPDAVERFVLEARTVNAIGHPNIVGIFDFGALPDGRQYLVMDLLGGQTLRRLLDHGRLEVGLAASLIDDCASALIATHAKGIVHRDLKPDNVYVADIPGGRRPEARLLDFGLVKLVAATHPSGGGVRTRTGAVLGTPSYMSPEQARAKHDVDHRTDIYALGVMSFEVLVGRRPYEARNVLDLLIAHAEAPIPSVCERVPAMPPEVAQLVEAMLAKRADDRPTLAAVRTVLKRLKGNAVIPSITNTYSSYASFPTRDESPEQLEPTLPFSSRGSAAVAMHSIPAFPAATDAVPPVASPPAIPVPSRVLPAGPKKARAVSARKAAVQPSSSPLWVIFAIAAVLVAIGGVLLGMSL